MNWPCWVFQQVTSTMDVAKAIALEGKHSKNIFTVASYEQTSGRGRNGSHWVAPASPDPWAIENTPEGPTPFTKVMESAGTLLPFTIAIPKERLSISLNWVSLAVGIGLCEAIEKWMLAYTPWVISEFGHLKTVCLKWPNDVLFWEKKKKISGVLCETSISNGDFKWVFVGIGFNLWTSPSDYPGSGALIPLILESCLEKANVSNQRNLKKLFSHLDNPLEKKKAAGQISELINDEITNYITGNRTEEQVLALAMEKMMPIGTPISVNKGSHRGVFLGLDSTGGLILEGPTGKRTFLSADVMLDAGINPPHEKERPSPLPIITSSKVVKTCPEAYLLLDLGNTRAHALFTSSLSKKHPLNFWHIPFENLQTSLGLTVPESLRPLCEAFRERGVKELNIFYVSVASQEKTIHFLNAIQGAIQLAIPGARLPTAEWKTPSLLIHSPELYEPLVNTYKGKLGADRALRFLKANEIAKKERKTVAVFSLGTAITAEVVGQDGTPLESVIAPGFEMGLRALNQAAYLKEATNSLTIEGFDLNPTPFGTAQAITSGICMGAVGLMNWIVNKHHVAHVLVCGGSAQSFFKNVTLPFEVHLEDCLELNQFQHFLNAKRQASSPPQQPLGNPSRVSHPWNGHGEIHKSTSYQNAFDPKSHMSAVLKSLERRRRIRKGDPLVQKPSRENFRRLGQPLTQSLLGPRLDRFLSHKYRFHSRAIWHQRIEQGEVLIQKNALRIPQSAGEAPDQDILMGAKPTYRLRLHDQIWIHKPPEEEPGYLPHVDAVYDDGDIVVFNKPGNVVIHSVGMYGKNTFLDIIKADYPKTFPVHRIDRETSGILLCARTPMTRHRLTQDFKENRIDKMYLTIVKGPPISCPLWEINAPIGPAVGSKIRLKLWVNTPEAVWAHTIVKALASIDNYHLLACVPVTGRTNQIRVHLASQGYWVVGDKMYCEDESVFLDFYENGITPFVLKSVETPRHFLHNAAIGWPGFADRKETKIEVCCPLAPDMLEFPIVINLLSKAKIPMDPQGQTQALLPIFREITLQKNGLLGPDSPLRV